MTTAPTIVGIDLGKNWFHLIGIDARGATVLRKKLERGQLAAFAVTASRAVVATEACAGSQYWGRVFAQAGHDVRLLPAQFVKPYVKANKNDFHDAAAIAEAASRASMRCVPLKTTEHLELQALHRMRQRAVRERTAVVNQMRALLLEHGIVVPVGHDLFARRLPATFAVYRPQFSWTRIKGESNVQGGRGNGSVEGGSRGGVLGAGTAVERGPEAGRGAAAAARRVTRRGVARSRGGTLSPGGVEGPSPGRSRARAEGAGRGAGGGCAGRGPSGTSGNCRWRTNYCGNAPASRSDASLWPMRRSRR